MFRRPRFISDAAVSILEKLQIEHTLSLAVAFELTLYFMVNLAFPSLNASLEVRWSQSQEA